MKHNILLGLVCLFTCFAVAGNNVPTIQIPLYYLKSCQQLTGTWVGQYVDPTDLLMSQSVRIALYAKNNHVIGEVTTLMPTHVATIHGFLWGRCQSGMVTHVFVGAAKHCGHFAPDGGVVAARLLMLYLPYENAMIDTNVLAILHRESDRYMGEKPSVDAISSLTSCH